jgi:hypothetical protein
VKRRVTAPRRAGTPKRFIRLAAIMECTKRFNFVHPRPFALRLTMVVTIFTEPAVDDIP